MFIASCKRCWDCRFPSMPITRILTEKQDEWERLAKGLLEYETLTGDEIRKVIAGESLGGDDSADAPPSGGGSASVTAIPKTKTRAKKPGSEPEPAPL